MKILRFLSILLLTTLTLIPLQASESPNGKLNVKETVLEHLGDGYDWHITTWGHTHISIPLPVILYSEATGFHVFSSLRLSHGQSYEGFFIDPTQKNKIYERINDKSTIRPWDFSITKNVVQIFIVISILLVGFLLTARWYQKHEKVNDAPKGFVGFMEMAILMVVDDIIRPSIGEKHYRPFVPYLLTVFFFIITTNLLGLIPIFPGGANVTGNITITMFLAICTFLVVNFSGNKEYWKEIFWPEVPAWLKVPIPLMPAIELFGIFTKPLALMIRLFANMVGGHSVILSLTCVIFIAAQMGPMIGTSMSVLSITLMIFMNFLELLVAFIQAYVFTMLSAVFIGLALPEHHG